MADGPQLQINPTELTFRFELKKNIPVTLSLYNPSGTQRVAFKVKTTSPKKYCVRPSSGFVEPKSTKDVQVIMQAQREYPQNLGECKDKFLVQWTGVEGSTKDVKAEVFDAAKNSDIKQAKLKVSLVGPPKPPSPVPEGVEEDASPAKETQQGMDGTRGAAAGGSDMLALVRERHQLREQVMQLQRENKEVLRRVGDGGVQATGVGGKQKVLRGGYNVIHLLLVAILAFLAGYLL